MTNIVQQYLVYLLYLLIYLKNKKIKVLWKFFLKLIWIKKANYPQRRRRHIASFVACGSLPSCKLSCKSSSPEVLRLFGQFDLRTLSSAVSAKLCHENKWNLQFAPAAANSITSKRCRIYITKVWAAQFAYK